MSQKEETRFRTGRVDPFLRTLKNTWATSIQQKTIRGTPDKILCIRGKFVGLELKKSLTTYSQSRKLQEYVISEIQKAGGVAMVVAPENWEEVKIILKKLDEGEV